MDLYIKGLASNVSLSGDEGVPSINVSSNETEAVPVREVIGNERFCEDAATFITGGKIEVRVGSMTGRVLSAAEMSAVKDGSLLDLDSDGVADQAEKGAGAVQLNIDLKDAVTEYEFKLTGTGSGYFLPLRYIFVCTEDDALVGDATLNLATSTGGTDLLNAQAVLVGAAGEGFYVDVTPPVAAAAMLADNASLFAKIAGADTGTAGKMKLIVEGLFV